jgi:2,3-dihydroxy-p-cumate/2,3-dihydroxybenzoate 3,4-dioxygenase
LIRYKKVGYVELNVTDLVRSRAFYERMVGLQYVAEGRSGEIFYRCSNDHHSIVLHRGAEPGLKRVGFMLESEAQFSALQRTLDQSGTPWEEVSKSECESRFLGRVVRMVEPNTRATLEFYVPRADTENAVFTPTLTKIQRIGHVVFWTPLSKEASTYFRNVLNFKVSDSIGEVATFMRPFPSPYHHGIGILKSERWGFHHVSLLVDEIDDVGRAFNRFRANDVTIANGIGRHPVSGSIFLYYFDPDGLTLEYSFGMEKFEELNAREPKIFPQVPESVDIWNAPRDVRMASVGEIETH